VRRILLYQGLMTASVIAITLGALLIGRLFTRSLDSSVRGENCQLPCWNNLRPGETTISEANLILHQRGYRTETFDPDPILTNTSFVAIEQQTICEVHLEPAPGGYFSVITLRPCSPVSMGDISSLIGEPESMLPLLSTMMFQDGQTILLLQTPICNGSHVSLHTLVRFIMLSDGGVHERLLSQPSNLPWHGFIPFWRYGQMYPDKPVCPINF
jgi:hypothetical protein